MNTAAGRLPWSRVIGYACGDAGCNIAFQMTGLFLLIYYTDVVGISRPRPVSSELPAYRSGKRP